MLLGTDADDDPSRWTRRLILQGGSERTLNAGTMTPLADRMTQEEGGEQVWKQTGAVETVCASPAPSGCASWRTQPVMGMVYASRSYVLRHLDYRICFAEPDLSAKTSGAKLVLAPPEARGVNHDERSFRWNFD